jgi:uncharacterized protein VirK/YbjX
MLKRIKFALRSFWYRRQQKTWYRLLSLPPLRPLVMARPNLLEKLHRPYIHAQWDSRRKLQALMAHYLWLAEPRQQRLCQALQCGSTSLAQWQADDISLQLVLSMDAVFQREGELVISLLDAEQRRIGSIALTRTENGVMWIGALQGLTGGDARERYRDLTHALHGLRPKNLLLIAAQHVARACAAETLRAVGNEAHVYSAARYQSTNNTERVHANYSEFWVECGGTPSLAVGASDCFELPMRYVVPPRETLPSKKRAMYERRRSMLAMLQEQMSESCEMLGLCDERVPQESTS